MYKFIWVRGEHIEVYRGGVFQFSADSVHEAEEEILNIEGD